MTIYEDVLNTFTSQQVELFGDPAKLTQLTQLIAILDLYVGEVKAT
jgi:hypothetical protein